MTDNDQWLTVEGIRKRLRCRRQRVIAAMDSGQLKFEQRGRIRYSPEWAVQEWERSLVKSTDKVRTLTIPAEFLDVL